MTEKASKLIFAGLDQAGKTTIYKATMEEMSLAELDQQQQRPTRGIERHAHDFLDHDFSVWDLGGQLNYRETYLSKPEVFNQTAALIFVVDIQDIDRLEEAYQYYEDILNILVNVDPMPKLYVLFHKFDPDKVSKLRSHFYKATRLFRQADDKIRQKFKGYATSIYSNSIDLAVKRILFENFEDYKEPTGSIKVRPKSELKKEEAKEAKVKETEETGVPKPKTEEKAPLPGEKPKAPTPEPTESKEVSAPTPEIEDKTKAPTPKMEEKEVETEVSEEEQEKELTPEQEADLDEKLEEATPKALQDLSDEVVEKLTTIINKRMKETPEIVALSILSSEGTQALAVAKDEIDYDRLATLREVVGSLNPKQFFKDLTDIEYRGLGHFSLSDFDIYFARASDDYAIAVLATDVSTLMLQNAQRIVRSIRQGLGMVPDDDFEDEDDEEPKQKQKRDLVSDLRSRIRSITGLDNLDE